MTEGTPPGPGSGDRPTDGESAGNPADRIVFTDDITDEAYAGQVRGVANTYHGKLQAIDRAKGRDRKDFILYKDDGGGQFAVQGAPGESLVLVDITEKLGESPARSLSIRTDPEGNVEVKVSEGDTRRGFTYSADGKTIKLFDTAIRDNRLLLSGDQRQAALGNIANDINTFGDSIAAEQAVFLPPPDLPQ